MRKSFYFLLSACAIILTSVYCFLTWEKRCHAKELKERLDKHYFKELNSAYFTFFEHDANNWRTNFADDWIERTKDHMSKDGYNWQQIKEMEQLARDEQKNQRRMLDWGYDDGLNGKDPDPYYLKDPHYMYGFKDGSKNKGK